MQLTIFTIALKISYFSCGCLHRDVHTHHFNRQDYFIWASTDVVNNCKNHKDQQAARSQKMSKSLFFLFVSSLVFRSVYIIEPCRVILSS